MGTGGGALECSIPTLPVSPLSLLFLCCLHPVPLPCIPSMLFPCVSLPYQPPISPLHTNHPPVPSIPALSLCPLHPNPPSLLQRTHGRQDLILHRGPHLPRTPPRRRRRRSQGFWYPPPFPGRRPAWTDPTRGPKIPASTLRMGKPRAPNAVLGPRLLLLPAPWSPAALTLQAPQSPGQGTLPTGLSPSGPWCCAGRQVPVLPAPLSHQDGRDRPNL